MPRYRVHYEVKEYNYVDVDADDEQEASNMVERHNFPEGSECDVDCQTEVTEVEEIDEVD
jgi:hypothetical protein